MVYSLHFIRTVKLKATFTPYLIWRHRKYISTLSLTSTLDEGAWLKPHPGRFTPGNDPVPNLWEVGWAPRLVWTRAENLASTRIRSPDRPVHNEFFIWNIPFAVTIIICVNILSIFVLFYHGLVMNRVQGRYQLPRNNMDRVGCVWKYY
jgi:hypothetical protein